VIDVYRADKTAAEAIGIVHAASWEAAYAPFFDEEFAVGQIASRLERWHQRVADDDGLILVGTVDERVLAFSWSKRSTERPGMAEILSFYGHPDGWGSGVAAELMAGTLRELRAEGFEQAHLWTLKETPQSRRFYTKAGFTETGATRPRDFGNGEPLAQVEYERGLTDR
jgi:L-amino acid N-acyltransferase YncA